MELVGTETRVMLWATLAAIEPDDSCSARTRSGDPLP